MTTLSVHPRIDLDVIDESLRRSWLTAVDNGPEAKLMWASMAHRLYTDLRSNCPDVIIPSVSDHVRSLRTMPWEY